MKKNRLFVLMLVIGMLLLAILACGTSTSTDGGGDSGGGDSGGGDSGGGDTGGSDTGGGMAQILVVNNTTGTNVCYLYVSVSNSDSWGDDQLGTDNILAPGDEYTVTDVPPGTYDLRAEDCDQNMIDEEYGVEVTSEVITWTFTDN